MAQWYHVQNLSGLFKKNIFISCGHCGLLMERSYKYVVARSTCNSQLVAQWYLVQSFSGHLIFYLLVIVGIVGCSLRDTLNSLLLELHATVGLWHYGTLSKI